MHRQAYRPRHGQVDRRVGRCVSAGGRLGGTYRVVGHQDQAAGSTLNGQWTVGRIIELIFVALIILAIAGAILGA